MQEETKLFIFIELVTQGSLASLYQKYHLRDCQVSGYASQILNGLNYLHERNVVHRWCHSSNSLYSLGIHKWPSCFLGIYWYSHMYWSACCLYFRQYFVNLVENHLFALCYFWAHGIYQRRCMNLLFWQWNICRYISLFMLCRIVAVFLFFFSF